MKLFSWISNVVFGASLACGLLVIHFASGLSYPIEFPAYWQAFTSSLGFGIPDAAHLVPTIGLIVIIILFLVEFFAALKLIARFRQVLMGVAIMGLALGVFAVNGFLLTIYSALPKPIETVPSILIYASFACAVTSSVMRTIAWLK